MNWLQKLAQDMSDSTPIVNYPVAGSIVSGLRVLEQVDNMSSIGASFYDYEILPDVREIPMSDFGSSEDTFYFQTENEKCRSLAEEIRISGEIMPLIVAIVPKKYRVHILEGGHRFVALGLLGVESFPALVVIDKD